MHTNSRKSIVLKLLTCIVGGAVLTPAFLCALPLLTQSRDKVPSSAIPELATLGGCMEYFAASYGHTDIRWIAIGQPRYSIRLDSC